MDMLEKKIRKAGLGEFNFKKTQWYKAIREDGRQYKFSLMIFSLGSSLLIPAIILLRALPSPATALLVGASSSIGIIVFEILFLVRFRDIRVMTYVCLAQMPLGLIAILYVSGWSLAVILLFAVCPVLCVQLRGTKRGVGWYASSVAIVLAAWGLQGSGAVLSPASALPVGDLGIALAASVFLFLLAWFSERWQESLVGRLTDLLMFDPTTGLPNKDVLSHSILRDRAYIFAIIKIENFSDLVALFGYEFSDVISQFASQKLLKYQPRYRYRTYQLKYNEYGLLIDARAGTTVADAAQCLNDVVKSLELESLPWERDRIKLVYRVGAAIVAPGDHDAPFSRADVALKKAERGHSVITVFEDGNDERDSAYQYVIRFTELVNNRETRAFRAVFQPVFNSDGSGIAWYEALLRIRKQDGSYDSIYPYLGVAKSTGFYQYLTDFILRKSADEILEHDVDISVNISINDIVRPDFIALVDEVHDRIRGKKGRIIFEILESDELVELDKCIWFIDYISHYGFKIAIDDFGTGYSNYCNLINLPVDIVKIDGSLIRQIKSDESARLLVEGIIHFCKKSNKKTVAEFVEDVHVFESLRDMNIDFFQGFYLSEPADIASCPCPSPR